MNYIAIDLGSYSIKFVEFYLDKKSPVYTSMQEVTLHEFIDRVDEGFTFQDLQFSIIKKYLEKAFEKGFDGKIVMQVPSSYLTMRTFNLPTNNRKKAEVLIPFQLEEDLPYSTSMHFAPHVIVEKHSSFAVVSVIEKSIFDSIYQSLDAKKVLPSILTSECALFQSYAQANISDPAYMILDIGHETTKGYFFHYRKMTSFHVSHIAGKNIDQVIQETYQVTSDEAVIFKHENSFFLTESQYTSADPHQKEFALIMKQIFTPLISEIKKWELGFRIKTGMTIQNIYICGGTTQIANIDNFLSENLNARVHALQTFKNIVTQGSEISEIENKNSFHVTNLISLSFRGKNPLGNFRWGEYASTDFENIPLHSISYIGSRALILSLIIFVGLIVERVVLHSRIDTLNKDALKILRDPSLQITRREQRIFKDDPQIIERKLKNQKKTYQQEVSTLQAAATTNSSSPLIKLSQVIGKDENVILLELTSTIDKAKVVFSSESVSTLEKLQQTLNMAGFQELKIDIDNKNKRLTATFNY